MSHESLVSIDKVMLGVWIALSALGFIYLIVTWFRISAMDIPALARRRAKWAIITGLVICGADFDSIYATIKHPVVITEDYIWRVLHGRPAWCIAIAAIIVFGAALRVSMHKQEEDIHREERRSSLRDALQDSEGKEG